MAMTTASMALDRKVLKEAYIVELKNVPQLWRSIVGRTMNTTQAFETIRQYKGLGPAEKTPEGEQVRFEDLTPGFSKDFRPYMVTKGVRFTLLFDYTAQYADIKGRAKDFAGSFNTTRNIVVTNLFNNGFTDTTAGMNNEPLFSATHALTGSPGTTLSNIVSGALSPLTIEAALAVLRRQKSLQNQPMGVTGKVMLMVPPELEGPAKRIVRSRQMAMTANNDENWFSQEIELMVNPYLTSTTAWFMFAMDSSQNFTFMLEQLPYQVIKIPTSTDLFEAWVAVESYIPGWYDWRGTVASTGL